MTMYDFLKEQFDEKTFRVHHDSHIFGDGVKTLPSSWTQCPQCKVRFNLHRRIAPDSEIRTTYTCNCEYEWQLVNAGIIEVTKKMLHG